jgi:hypothetical protein
MADRYQGRPFPADDHDRGSDQHDSGGADPLAELARLIGQTDPFGTMGKSNPAAAPPVPRAAPRFEPQRYEEPQYEEPQYDEPVEEEPPQPSGPPAWMQRANARAVPQSEVPAQEDYPNAVHPLRRHALPAPQYEDYPEEQVHQEGKQHADPSRYDDALYGQLQGGTQDYQREAAYPDDPYAYQDGYEDEPEPVRKRAGLLTVAAVLALAIVGTGAAFAYRTYIGGPKSGDPPIIKADNAPTKVIPAPADTASKTPDRMPIGDGSEKIVPREEKPVDVNANSGAPRVVFPPLNPNANPPSPASVATAAPPPTPAAVPTNGTLPSSEPRKIKTLSVRGDQADAGPAPPPAPAAAAASAKPAKSAATTPRSAPPAAAGANAPLSLAPDAQASAPAPAPEPRRVATLQPPPGAPNAPTNPAAAPAGGGYLVQVSSQRSESDAQSSYKALQSRYPAVLGSHTPVIKRADLGDKGIYYRAMVGPFGTPEEASQFCGNLKTAGGQCVVQKN